MLEYFDKLNRSAGIAGILLLSVHAFGQSQSDTVAARDLLRLKQVELIQAAIEKNKGKPTENLYRAQLVLATWDTLPNLSNQRARATQNYIENLGAYLKAYEDQPSDQWADGLWALDHMKFMISTLTDPIVTRTECFGVGELNRQELEAVAFPLGRVAEIARKRMNLAVDAAEKKLAQDPRAEKEYMTLYSAQQEVDLYQSWAAYIRGLAIPEENPQYSQTMKAVVNSITPWAEVDADHQDINAKFMALLLRARARGRAGDFAGAQADLAAATSEQAPVWGQYQGRYQLAVLNLKMKQWREARQAATEFKNWVDTTPAIASSETRALAELLLYRVERAETLARSLEVLKGDAREKTLAKAEDILRDVLRKHPQFKDFVLELLIIEAAGDADGLTSLENIGVAWGKLTRIMWWADDAAQQKEWRDGLQHAKAAAAGKNPAQLPQEKAEAALLVAGAYGKLGQWLPAAEANLNFAEQYPTDTRAKDVAELALAELEEFRKSAANTPEVQQLTLRALNVAIDKLSQKQWLYAKGTLLEEMKQREQATAAFNAVPQGDEHYFDARYRLLRIAVDELAELQAARTPIDKQKQTARLLLKRCEDYLAEIKKLPADAAQKHHLPDVWLMEAGVYLNPLEQPEPALKRLADLEKQSQQLSPAVMGALLRYKVQAYQRSGDSAKAATAVTHYAERFPQEGPEFIRQMVALQTQEIMRIEKSDPEKAARLAAGMTGLLDPLITMAQTNQSKEKDIYIYRQLKADMLARAGNGTASRKMWEMLQQDQPDDLYNFLGEARAMFIAKQFDLARDLFSRILPKVPVGSETYWECYLRIVQSDEARGKSVDVRRLRDLKVTFGTAAGGKEMKEEFDALFKKYGAE